MGQLFNPQAEALVVPGASRNPSEDDEQPPDTSARGLPRTAVLRPLRPRAVVNRLPVSDAANRMRLRLFPGTSKAEWNDWRWQVRNRIRDLAALERVFRLSEAEREAVRRHTGSLPVGITPYYASLMDADDPQEALRRTHVPTLAEFERMPGEADDPLGEDHDTVVPGLVHRYPDRVLFLATPFCSTYCRYCTRAHGR